MAVIAAVIALITTPVARHFNRLFEDQKKASADDLKAAKDEVTKVRKEMDDLDKKASEDIRAGAKELADALAQMEGLLVQTRIYEGQVIEFKEAATRLNAEVKDLREQKEELRVTLARTERDSPPEPRAKATPARRST